MVPIYEHICRKQYSPKKNIDINPFEYSYFSNCIPIISPCYQVVVTNPPPPTPPPPPPPPRDRLHVPLDRAQTRSDRVSPGIQIKAGRLL